ncbi:MAG: type I-G CRISPR-associated protein Csb2, partial [Stackebrandtia sp.]
GKATAEVRIAESVRRAGYPPPVEVEALPAPAVPGALYRPDFTFVKRDKLHRPMMHARIRFAAPVRGPVLAGALRYRGIGLFIPDIKD